MTNTKSDEGSRLVLHWPEMGIEYGEYTSEAELGDQQGIVTPQIIALIGAAASVLHRTGIIGIASAITALLVGTGMVGGTSAAVTAAVAVTFLSDELMDYVWTSPVKFVAGVVVSVAVLVPLVIGEIIRGMETGSLSELVVVGTRTNLPAAMAVAVSGAIS